MAAPAKAGRTRVERSIYRQPNGKYAVCARRAGRLHFCTAGRDLGAARRARAELIAALEAGRVPASPRQRLDTVASRWSARFEAMVAAGERHRRTYEAHRFHLDHDILPRFGHRRIGSLGVEDIADLIGELRTAGRCRGRQPTPSPRCRASCASPAAAAGSRPIRSSCSNPRSVRDRRAARADGCSGARRWHAFWSAAHPPGAYRSRLPSSAACGSPSCSG